MSRILDVYLNSDLAGKLAQNDSGILSFSYIQEYVSSKKTALSISLPLQDGLLEGNNVKAFFSGLLPDDFLRHKLSRYLGVSEKNPFALLEAIGGECAGAVSLYPEGVLPHTRSEDDIEILDDNKLKEIIALLKRRPLLAGDDDMRLSLAGAQDKLAVGYNGRKVLLIKGTTPTTHILKPLIETVEDSVHNEFFCMRLAKQLGIDVPKVDIDNVDGLPYFLVERYDRKTKEGASFVRIHQEDFCQALGMLPDIKYEREGGPNMSKCQELIVKHSSKPALDQMQLIQRIIFNYLIGNADAHGKNFSFLYTGKRPQLAPAYDLLSTAVYPELSKKMAMKIGGKYKPEDVYLRHWHRMVADREVARKNLEKQLLTLSQGITSQIPKLIEILKKQGITSPIFDDIHKVVNSRAERIFNQLS